MSFSQKYQKMKPQNILRFQAAIILSALLTASLALTAQAQSEAPTPTPTQIINHYETPLQAVLTENDFSEHQELSSIVLTQALNRVENPDEVTITLTQSGFLDDSIEGMKEIYQLRHLPKGWVIESKEIYVKCYRGPNTTDYVKQICL